MIIEGMSHCVHKTETGTSDTCLSSFVSSKCVTDYMPNEQFSWLQLARAQEGRWNLENASIHANYHDSTNNNSEEISCTLERSQQTCDGRHPSTEHLRPRSSGFVKVVLLPQRQALTSLHCPNASVLRLHKSCSGRCLFRLAPHGMAVPDFAADREALVRLGHRDRPEGRVPRRMPIYARSYTDLGYHRDLSRRVQLF